MQLTTLLFIIIMATLTVAGTADNAQDGKSKRNRSPCGKTNVDAGPA